MRLPITDQSDKPTNAEDLGQVWGTAEQTISRFAVNT